MTTQDLPRLYDRLGGAYSIATVMDAAALREPAPAPEVADLALSSFFQVRRKRPGRLPPPQVSTTRRSTSFGSISTNTVFSLMRRFA